MRQATTKLTLAAAAAAGLALVGCVQAPNDFEIAANKARTPGCSGSDGAVLGRISGTVYTMPGQRPVSYVGCFPDIASCEAWRRSIVGTVNGRIIYNECVPR
jgi:hypothetical protein